MSENIVPEPTATQGSDLPAQAGLNGSVQPAESMAGRSDPQVVSPVIVPHKKFPLLLLFLIPVLVTVAVIAIYVLLQARVMYQQAVVVTSPSPTPTASVEEVIKEVTPIIATPVSKSVIKSPVTIKGTVPPGWMFEGQFPVEIRTTEGKLLATGIAKEVNPGEWSSGTDVDFTVSLTFNSSGESGTIILLSDNPSGDPSKQKNYSYGIFFK